MTFANRNQGGSGVYARALLTALRERDDVTPWIVEGPRRSNIVRTMGWLTRGARKSLQERKPQVLHCPSFVAPWSVDLPLVITVHDAAGSRYPADHPLEWRVYERWLMPRRLRAAVRIITGSEFARGELIEVYRLDPSRVVSVPYGLDPRFLAYANGEAPSKSRDVILFPGAPIGRKNLDLVLGAMAHAQPDSPLARAELQISGARESDFGGYARQIHQLGLAGRVRWLGMIPFSDLPATFAATTVVVYPSFYEGFGFPPLEAMAVGTPVVASNRGSLPEVLGDASLTLDPGDERALAAALNAVLSQPDLRAALREKGKTRARLYTWAKCAERTVDVYRDAVN
jgi:glycosyltransferase involved in cell wall biosynthesis